MVVETWLGFTRHVNHSGETSYEYGGEGLAAAALHLDSTSTTTFLFWGKIIGNVYRRIEARPSEPTWFGFMLCYLMYKIKCKKLLGIWEDIAQRFGIDWVTLWTCEYAVAGR